MTRLVLWVLALFFVVSCKNEAPAPAPSAAVTPEVIPAPAVASAPPAEAPAKKQAGRPFLYRVEGQGAKKGSGWLLGTIHMGADPDEALHPIVWQQFDAAKTVIIEADIGSIGPMDAARLVMLPEGQSLKKMLTEAQWNKLDDMTGMFVPESSLDRMKPAFALAMVVKELLPQTASMDGTLQERAKTAGKALEYLETVDEQVKMMDQAIDAEVLAFSLDHAADMKARLGEMTAAYLAGDEPELMKSAFDPEEMKAHPEMFEKLFYERNEKWIAKIEPWLARDGAFIAVGAGHLVGDGSVVDLLTKAGWKVTRATIE